MSQSKPLPKPTKPSSTQPKTQFAKKAYLCYYCHNETKNASEICSFCEQNNESDENPHYSKLTSVRVPLKNLVYIIGLPQDIAKEETLGSYEYLGQYGKIKKLVVSKNKTQKQNGTFSAYVTYTHEREAALAIYAIDETPMMSKTIRAFFGTTKYCTYFLKETKCLNEECVYLHEYVKDDNMISTEEHEKKKVTLTYLCQFYEDFKKIKPKTEKTSFPSISGILKSLDKTHENKLISDKKIKKGEKAMNKPLDIISMEDAKGETKDLPENEQNSKTIIEENDGKARKKINKNKAGSKDYHSDENSNVSLEESEDTFNKMRRKTVNVSDIDQLIIKSFISEEFLKHKNSRFGFAKGEGEKDEKTKGIIENRENIERSIQNFFLKWNNKHFAPEENSTIFNFSSQEHKDD